MPELPNCIKGGKCRESCPLFSEQQKAQRIKSQLRSLPASRAQDQDYLSAQHRKSGLRSVLSAGDCPKQ